MIDVRALTKKYGDFTAVDDLTFKVEPGEVMGLLGPNGAGKTTTLRCLAGIIPPTSGELFIAGHSIRADPVAAKRQLAFFADEPRLFDYLTVWQHLVFVARLYQIQDFEVRAESLLKELELSDKRRSLPAELSRGMKQKLAIACGFLHAPRVVFFDEPLTGLDPYGIRRMKDAIRRRAAEGTSILISSHLLHLLEEVCSHVLILKGGRRIFDGELGEVASRFGGGQRDASLEEIFFRATGDGNAASPPAVPDATIGAVYPPPIPPAPHRPDVNAGDARAPANP